jgi:cell division protein FtsL
MTGIGKMTKGQKHAYKQAPWRIQLRGIAGILVFLVVFILVAIVNLNVSAKTYAAGIEIQRNNREKDSLNHRIADLKNDLGVVTSYELLAAKAAQQGYQTITEPERIVYIVVPGYQKPAVDIETPKRVTMQNGSVLKPVYTQSLWDLFMDGALKLNKSTKGSYQ